MEELGIDVVLDAVGLMAHGMMVTAFAAGAKKYYFLPGTDDLDATIVYGVNHESLTAQDKIVSNASCTTNCIIPIIKYSMRHFRLNRGQ